MVAAFCRDLEWDELSTTGLTVAEMLLRYVRLVHGGVGYTGRGHGFSYLDQRNIAVKELVPIVMVAAIWGP